MVQVGGALSAVLLTQQYLGALIGPIIGAPINEAIGFPAFCLIIAIALVVLYTPCAYFLIPYQDPGTCFAPKAKAAE